MTYSEARDYLSQIRNKRLQILVLESRIQAIRFEMEHPLGSVNYAADRVQTSAHGDGMERRILKYVKVLEKNGELYAELKTQYAKAVHEAFMKIEPLPDCVTKDFLLRHFIDGISEIDYAVERGYETTASVYKLRQRAIKFFARYY